MNQTPIPTPQEALRSSPVALLPSNPGRAAMIWRRFRKHPGAIAGLLVLCLLILAVVLVDFSPYDGNASNMNELLLPPSWQHPMGTDALGRDLLTRVLLGGRVSLTVGLIVVVISLGIGVSVGALAGFSSGRVDGFLMRITDMFLSLPSFMVLILISAILREVEAPFFEKNNILTIGLVIGLLGWMTFARLVRAVFLILREMDYITASRCLGASGLTIVTSHILPNAIGPIIVESTLELGYAIIEESGLSFLGFGIQPPTPSWGNLLSSAQDHFIAYPWLAIFPGLMIFLTIISVNYIGDGLRDAFDPYKVLTKVGNV